MKKPAYALFIDLAAAFDHVGRYLIFKTVCLRINPRTNTKLIQLMESLYSHITTVLAQIPDGDFELSNGIRQGGPETPPLFDLFMDLLCEFF